MRDLAIDAFARLDHVGRLEVQVVDEVEGENFAGWFCRSGWRLRFWRRFVAGSGSGAASGLLGEELRDYLRLAVVRNLEIVLGQRANGLAVGIAHDDADGNQFRVDL